MAVTDYNKKKNLEVTSQNDSGSTIDKAQPVLLVGGDDSTTGTGDIVLDWSNISSESDIAVYDQNGNLLPYEIEEFDATSETAVLWCWNSWVRDDSVQAQVVYGDGPASSEENVSGTWNNTGQNVVMVQHLNDNADDSTSNNNDGSISGATSVNNSIIDGGYSFDGTDDEIEVANAADDLTGEASMTAIIYANIDTLNGNFRRVLGTDDGTGGYSIGLADSNEWQWFHRDNGFDIISGNPSTGTDYHIVARHDSSTGLLEVDRSQIGSGSFSGATSDPSDVSAFIGQNNNFDEPWAGEIADVRVFVSDSDSSAYLSDDWLQADYDASPKAGQVFFSQQAAESTVNTKTTTVDYDTAIQDKGLTTTVDYDAAIQDTLTVTPDYDLALQQQGKTQTVDYDTAIQTTGITINVDYNAAVGYRINGYVKVEGSSTQGVDVMVYNLTSKTHIGHTTTDSNGDYEISDVDNISSGDKISVAVDYYDSNDDTYYGSEKTTVV